MRLPNFRSFTTQAVTGILLASLAVVTVMALAYCAIRGLDWENKVINYNAKEGMGQYRPNLVLGLTALTVLISLGAGALGFNSLGQKRNERPGLSWLGLAVAALCIPAAVSIFFFWNTFAESILK